MLKAANKNRAIPKLPLMSPQNLVKANESKLAFPYF